MKHSEIIFIILLFIFPRIALCQGNSKTDSIQRNNSRSCINLKLSIKTSKYTAEENCTIGGKLEVWNLTDSALTLPTELSEDYFLRIDTITSLGEYTDVVYQIQVKTSHGYQNYDYPPSTLDIDALYILDTFQLYPNFKTIYFLSIVPYNTLTKGKYRARVYFNAVLYSNCNNLWSNWVYFEITKKKNQNR